VRIVGSNMSPQGLALEDGVVAVSTKSLNKVLSVDKDNMRVTIEPGVKIGKRGSIKRLHRFVVSILQSNCLRLWTNTI